MDWRTRIGFALVAIAAFVRLAFAAPMLPAAHADDGTPTPTPTPASAQCNDVHCG